MMTKTLQTTLTSTALILLLSACGGGGGGGPTGNGSNNGGPNGLPGLDPAPPGPARNYADLVTTTGTSPLLGAVLSAGNDVAGTTGTITHSDQTFTASGFSGATPLSASSAFNLPDFEFATDIALGATGAAVVGVGTQEDDVRTTGTAAYSGNFAGQLVDSSQITATTLNWTADVQVDFAGSGDVDLTFVGGGSDLIDTIRIQNATINGARISGGTISTFNDGLQNDITGSSVDMDGAFFGYNNSLLLPGELGGGLVSNDADTDISGLFITAARP